MILWGRGFLSTFLLGFNYNQRTTDDWGRDGTQGLHDSGTVRGNPLCIPLEIRACDTGLLSYNLSLPVEPNYSSESGSKPLNVERPKVSQLPKLTENGSLHGPFASIFTTELQESHSPQALDPHS